MRWRKKMARYGKTGKPGAVRGSSTRRGVRTDIVIPVNIERVLLRAAGDPAFRQALIESPEGALEGQGFSLLGSERAMLASMTRSTLEAMIESINPGRQKRARFAKRVAAAVAGTMLISTAACGSDGGNEYPDAGADPDVSDVTDVPDTDISDTADVDTWDTPVVDAGVDTWVPDTLDAPDDDESDVESDAEEEDVDEEDAEEEG